MAGVDLDHIQGGCGMMKQVFARGRDSGRKKREVLGEPSQSDVHVEEGNQGADVSQLQVEQVRLT